MTQRLYSRVWGEPRPDLSQTDDRDTDMPSETLPRLRYAVVPGPLSIAGGHPDDFHFMNARELMRLYNVNPAECIVLRPGDDRAVRGLAERRQLIVLRPRADGNYTLPPE